MANQYDTNLKLQAIADAIGDSSSSGLISALEDIADAVAGGGGGSSAGLVSDNFSETDTYDLGDYCIHNNTLYVCINAITTSGPWDLSDWQATNAGIQLSLLNSALANLFGFVSGSSGNVNVTANATANLSVTLSIPTGYTIGAIKTIDTGNTGIHIESITISGTTINSRVYNATNATKIANLSVSVMYVKA